MGSGRSFDVPGRPRLPGLAHRPGAGRAGVRQGGTGREHRQADHPAPGHGTLRGGRRRCAASCAADPATCEERRFPETPGNCVIAGHRDTHFRVLKDIRVGDEIVLETRSGRYVYRVRRLRVVSPDNTAPLRPASDAELNLITCYPFYYVGAAPKRFVVEARLARSEIAGSSM